MTRTEEMLRVDPEAIEGALRGAARPLETSGPVHWHGVAFAAASRARSAFAAGDAARGLRWARCAVAVYEALAAEASPPHPFDEAAMRVRVAAIAACGAGDEILDPAVVVGWVSAALEETPGGAVRRSTVVMNALAVGEEPSIEEALALRRMKKRLAVLAGLAKVNVLPADLAAWLAVRDRLV